MISNLSIAQTDNFFEKDNYKIHYPYNWKHQVLQQPNGDVLNAFMAPEEKKSIAYCHITQMTINPELTPKLASLSDRKMREFVLNSDPKELFFSVYLNLPQSQGFNIIHTTQTLVDNNYPALMTDFVFSIPNGFNYRVRSHLVFWNRATLSIWCQTAARNSLDADNSFQKYLPEFMRFISKVKIINRDKPSPKQALQ